MSNLFGWTLPLSSGFYTCLDTNFKAVSLFSCKEITFTNHDVSRFKLTTEFLLKSDWSTCWNVASSIITNSEFDKLFKVDNYVFSQLTNNTTDFLNRRFSVFFIHLWALRVEKNLLFDQLKGLKAKNVFCQVIQSRQLLV